MNIGKKFVLLIIILFFCLSIQSLFSQQIIETKVIKPYEIEFFKLKDVLGREHNLGEFSGFANSPKLALYIPIELDDIFFDQKVKILKLIIRNYYNKNLVPLLFTSGRVSSRKVRNLIDENGINSTVLMDNYLTLTEKVTNKNEYGLDNIFLMGKDRKIQYIYNISEDFDYTDFLDQLSKRYEELLDMNIEKQLIIPDSHIDLFMMSNPKSDFSVCACPTQPYGGFSRYAYIVDEYIRKNKISPITIINGNLLGNEQNQNLHNYFFKSCEALNPSAMVPAVNDFIEGYQFLELFINKIPLLSSNINQNYLDIASHKIVNINNMKIVIIGLTPLNVLEEYRNLKSDFLIKDYDTAIDNVIDKLNSDFDLIILSGHFEDSSELVEIAKKHNEIGFLVNSNSERISSDEFIINNYDIPLLEAGNRGEYASSIRLRINNKKAEAINVYNILLDSTIEEHGEILRYLYEYQDRFSN